MRGFGPGLLLGFAGCATVVPGAAPRGATSIAYETGPCFGACPVYRVTVNSDGTGRFEGQRFTAVEGERTFRITPERYRALLAHLEPLRPARGSVRYSGEACETMATDLPSAEVTWRTPGDGEQQLYFYHGCDMERNRAIAERLDAVPSLLPIGEFIASRQ